jgi:hypothetical protein
MNIFDHPGNLGAVRGSLLTIHHADWPAYPQGADFHETLFQFTAFPKSTGFVVIDDIDRSLLMIADVPSSHLSDPFDARNFHIAAWHEDLASMQADGFIEGITPASEEEWQRVRWDDLVSSVPEGAKIGFKDANGNFIEIQPPPMPEVDEDEEYQPFVIACDKRISITNKGREYIYSSLLGERMDISEAISPRVSKLYDLQYFDTCIREACVQLEHEIKLRVKSDRWGDRLTEAFIENLRDEGGALESAIRTYRQELRTVFKLIRNDYMHNLSEADEVTAYSILSRIARVRSILNMPQSS